MRKGDYTGTYTGGEFWVEAPVADEVKLADIAHALSLTCRYGGHCLYHYSVAQHCLNGYAVMKAYGYSDSKVLFYMLMHDAAEAYMCDIPRPIKTFWDAYKAVEKSIMSVVYQHFQVPEPDYDTTAIVKFIDDVLLTVESRQLMKDTNKWHLVEVPPTINLSVVDLRELDYRYNEKWFLNISNHLLNKIHGGGKQW